jgi:Ca2+/H+ antiporter
VNTELLQNNDNQDDMMKKIYQRLTPEEIEYLKHHEFIDEEKEAAKISAVYFIITLVLMIFTAHQLSENPDGVYSNMCRLAITVVGLVVKILLLPFRKICGYGTRQGYSHHLVSNDPYGGETSRMEII